MNKRKKAEEIQKILEEHFPHPDIPLKHKDPYTLLIAVVLSARNTDAKVNQITPHLFAKADTPQKMIELSIDEIRQIIKPCGLSPTKAKAIWHLSKILLEKYQGQVPKSFKALEELPGVGHKTASVVMAQAFQYPAFPIDTHIQRSAKRWGLSRGKTVKQTESDLKKLFKRKDWIKLHLQIIYFARKFCPARGHKPSCPICLKQSS
ncbi:MAG: endonuclease III [Rhabdochlamydiaceae bacterium]|jgi:endonuclease-3